jgi:hypothetical protein
MERLRRGGEVRGEFQDSRRGSFKWARTPAVLEEPWDRSRPRPLGEAGRREAGEDNRGPRLET